MLDDGETVEATCLLVKRDKFEFKINLIHKRNKYRYCEFILYNSYICIKIMLITSP
jgi:hypothetical protein